MAELTVYDDPAYGREVLLVFTDGTQLSVCIGVKQTVDARYCRDDTRDNPIFTRVDCGALRYGPDGIPFIAGA